MKQPVVIGRFQVPQMTEGHKQLISAVYKEFQVTPVVLIGVSPLPCTPNNPLTFEQRQSIVRQHALVGAIYPLLDMPTDDLWSQQIDVMLGALCFGREPVLCGGPDSFLPHYKGKFLTWEFKQVRTTPTGTDYRKTVEPSNHEFFIRGAVWATQQQFPRVDSTVDALVTKTIHLSRCVLIGQKPDGRWVFPGGYIDVRETAEHAVRRELMEETGLSDGTQRLLGTHVVNDWRYRGEKRMSVLTHVFQVHDPIGGAQASDDLEDLEWVNEALVGDKVIPAHRELWEQFRGRLIYV